MSEDGFILACGILARLLERLLSRGIKLTKEEKVIHKMAKKMINNQYKRNLKP